MAESMSTLEDRIRNLPLWQGEIRIEPLEGGLSNQSYKVADAERAAVVRFGQDFPFHHVSREREAMAAKAAGDAGLAPELLHAEPGVMVFRFIAGRTFAERDVRDNIEEIAALVRRFHLEMPHHVSGAGRIFWVFLVIRDYARTLEAAGSRKRSALPRYLELAAKLEAVQTPLPIVFGHHDLLPANFIRDSERLWLIDFEYAAFSTPMFDLAGIASNAGFDEAEAEALLTAYFGRPPDDELRRSHAAMQCASLLREAMWSMVSELHLETPGVDFVAYTEENLERLEHALTAYAARYGEP
jgi:thiamine kinase-like enzyme